MLAISRRNAKAGHATEISLRAEQVNEVQLNFLCDLCFLWLSARQASWIARRTQRGGVHRERQFRVSYFARGTLRNRSASGRRRPGSTCSPSRKSCSLTIDVGLPASW